MGATSIFHVFLEDHNKEDLEAAFRELQEEESEINGHQHGYSGDFQTFDSLRIYDRTFDDLNTAIEFCFDKSEKWISAAATKFKDAKGIERWVIGGWAAT